MGQGIQIVAALQRADQPAFAERFREGHQLLHHRRVAVYAHTMAAERVHPVAVEAGGQEDDVRSESPCKRVDQLPEGCEIAGVADAGRKGNVYVIAFTGAITDFVAATAKGVVRGTGGC